METLLAELNSIPDTINKIEYPNLIEYIKKTEKYDIKKYRFIKILQSVNPNFKIKYNRHKIKKITVSKKIPLKVHLVVDFKDYKDRYIRDIDYYIKLVFKHCVIKGTQYNFNSLKYNHKHVAFYDTYYYDCEYVEKLIKLYYTNNEFIENVPNKLIVLLPRDLINLIYSYTTSSLVFG